MGTDKTRRMAISKLTIATRRGITSSEGICAYCSRKSRVVESISVIGAAYHPTLLSCEAVSGALEFFFSVILLLSNGRVCRSGGVQRVD